ncbi:spore germination protein GerW family protein [Halogranum rubrum]|nr:spore germination protein GerW family protein [Halogranum salarium]
MSVPTDLVDMVSILREHANVQTVFGDPIVGEGRTVVPVARIRYGFGGGYGTTPAESDEMEAKATDADESDESGTGGGFGGGVVASPVGVVELTPNGTRFVRVGSRERLFGALGVGVVFGYLLGRRRLDRTET